MNDDMSVKVISWLSAGAVAVIAFFSFAISYAAQRELALAAGIHPWLSYVFPLVIDGFIVVASLSVLRNSLVGEGSRYQWAMVGLFTVLSIAFNAAHAHDVLLDLTIFGLPVTLIPHVAMPVALFFGFEMLMRQIHHAISRAGMIKSLADLHVEFKQTRAEIDTELDTRQAELAQLTRQITELGAEISEKTAKAAELEQDISRLEKGRQEAQRDLSSAKVRKFIPGDADTLGKANAKRNATMKQRRQKIQEMFRSGWTVGNLADYFGVDIKTVQRDAVVLGIELIGRGRNASIDTSPKTFALVMRGNGTGNLNEGG